MMVRSLVKSVQWWAWGLILLISSAVIGSGYWLFHQSIERAVDATTLSFMEQLADHDHLNVINQMNSKREYLQTLLARIEATRDAKLEEVIYDLGVEARTTSFNTLYLITTDDVVYSSAYLEASLESMAWAEDFRQAEGSFVTRYDEITRE